jgi:alkylation response protein AidB-like acyl-CoA dehydrogenase
MSSATQGGRGEFSLSQAVLDRCHERAAGYDRDNRFFDEDFAELRDAGYLLMTVPREHGGYGMSLAEVARVTRRLAYHAPATALALNMHHYWVGVAADLWRAGDRSVAWILEEAGRGAVFAAGHAESGNDLPLLLSTTKAERVDGGYRFTGRKSFGSLTPVWTFLGLHGMDTGDPARPRIVHAFAPRATEGISIKETWDVMGMRATRSDDTVLQGAFVPDRYVARVVPAGAAGIDHFILGIYAWALVNFGNVYYGLATRVRDLIVELLKTKTSLGLTRPMAYHPMAQHGVAEMVFTLESILPQLEAVAEDWSRVTEHGPEFALRIVAAKYNAVEGAFRVADRALDLSGGFGMFRKSELERLFRDARAGRFHPANSHLAHELVAKMTLGIDLDEQPRWG